MTWLGLFTDKTSLSDPGVPINICIVFSYRPLLLFKPNLSMRLIDERKMNGTIEESINVLVLLFSLFSMFHQKKKKFPYRTTKSDNCEI